MSKYPHTHTLQIVKQTLNVSTYNNHVLILTPDDHGDCGFSDKADIQYSPISLINCFKSLGMSLQHLLCALNIQLSWPSLITLHDQPCQPSSSLPIIWSSYSVTTMYYLQGRPKSFILLTNVRNQVKPDFLLPQVTSLSIQILKPRSGCCELCYSHI